MNLSKEILIFIGPPGAGKGTLAQLCSSRMGWIRCSTGDLCRKNVQEKTEFGAQIDLAIKSGKLISDSLILGMVDTWLSEHSQNNHKIILDGFPRTPFQAEQLDVLLRKAEFAHFAVSVVRMELDNEVALERLMSRVICGNGECCAVYSTKDSAVVDSCFECAAPLVRRSDDNIEQVIRDRLATYHVHAHNLVQHYHGSGRVVRELNVAQPVEGVFEQFIRLMDMKIS